MIIAFGQSLRFDRSALARRVRPGFRCTPGVGAAQALGSGRSMTKTAPAPGLEVTESPPWCFCTITE
jgi:hypothetical protein